MWWEEGRKCGKNESLLIWFCHLERRDESLLVKQMYIGSKFFGNRPAGKMKNRWSKSVKKCLMKIIESMGGI